MIHQDLAMFSHSTPGDHGCPKNAQALACRAPLQGRAKGATQGQGEEANGEGDLEKRDGWISSCWYIHYIHWIGVCFNILIYIDQIDLLFNNIDWLIFKTWRNSWWFNGD